MLDNVKKRLKEYGDKDEWVKVLSRQNSNAVKENVWVLKPTSKSPSCDEGGWMKLLSRRKTKAAKEMVCVPKPSLVPVKTKNKWKGAKFEPWPKRKESRYI